MTVPIDYEVLRLIWWLLLGVLLIGFAIMDGFDLGVAMLLPYVARKDAERRVTINAIGPFWEGNQVWLILGGGAVFAAWPPIYAASTVMRLPGLRLQASRSWAWSCGGWCPGCAAGTSRSPCGLSPRCAN